MSFDISALSSRFTVRRLNDSDAPALQGTVPPVLDVDVGFLVQFADGGGRDLAAPQRLGDVLYPAHGDARQIHLDEGLLHAALPAAIPLDDGSLEGYALEPRYMERDVTRSGGLRS